MNQNYRRLALVSALLAGSLATRSTFALGYRNPDQGARATAQGEAFVAQADDASAIYYNPAGLTQVKGTQFTSGSYLSMPDIAFDPDVGKTIRAHAHANYLPHLYVASDLGLERWRFGLGVNAPYGNAIDWGKSSPFQYLVTKSSLAVMNIAPTLAFQVNDQLSLGAGVNVYYAKTEVHRNLLPYPYFIGGSFRYDAEGWAVGGTLGALWKPHPQHAVGLVYRLPFRVDFDGTAKIVGSLADAKAGADVTLDFPQSLAVGYAFWPTKKLKLEVDVEWTDWRTLNTPRLESGNANFDGQPTPFNWRASWFYEFGVEYQCTDALALRAGYIYSDNTVPDSTLNPTLPDNNRHVLSAGLGYTKGRLSVDLTYQFSYTEPRKQTLDTDGTEYPISEITGKWHSTGHAVMLTSTFRF
jgi:long-chain fatty acid transport protein